MPQVNDDAQAVPVRVERIVDLTLLWLVSRPTAGAGPILFSGWIGWLVTAGLAIAIILLPFKRTGWSLAALALAMASGLCGIIGIDSRAQGHSVSAKRIVSPHSVSEGYSVAKPILPAKRYY